ncbi:MAG: DUF177 domain-containing protein [Acidobacteria bacterium]|nr:DUF177 domain-containing protein [Acidobacteriota bacterium]MCI0620188.1 DUF177 domain-containing protein [Acidobacteriota bacterium]MCI0720302.1 DUF177 domain-containing protein [Acidobacteriota bacterium]
MRIDVRELDLGPLALKGEILESELGFDPSEIRVLGRIVVDLTAERQVLEVRIRGRLTTDVGLPCSRCLESVQFPVATEFDQFYESNAEHPLHGEIALHERDTEIGFFSGDFIEVSDIVREQILLSLPMKPICREDCKGLCPHCGKNRNLSDCNCESVLVDPRLLQLLKIKNRMTF